MDHIEQALADAMAAPRIQWPKERAAGRLEDMGPGHIRVVLDSDNDVCVAVWDGEHSASVEFVNPGGGGGGRSSRTRMALIALMVAIEADNAERPDLAFPPQPEISRQDGEAGAGRLQRPVGRESKQGDTDER